jgi:hypothetical protein
MQVLHGGLRENLKHNAFLLQTYMSEEKNASTPTYRIDFVLSGV